MFINLTYMIHGRHPNIVRLYGYCLDLPTVCLIMELLPTSLDTLLHPAEPIQDVDTIPTSTDFTTNASTVQETQDTTAHASSITQSSLIALPMPYMDNRSQPHSTSAVTAAASKRSSAKVVPVASSTTHETKHMVCKLGVARTLSILHDISGALAHLHDKDEDRVDNATGIKEKVAHRGRCINHCVDLYSTANLVSCVVNPMLCCAVPRKAGVALISSCYYMSSVDVKLYRFIHSC